LPVGVVHDCIGDYLATQSLSALGGLKGLTRIDLSWDGMYILARHLVKASQEDLGHRTSCKVGRHSTCLHDGHASVIARS